ncbi:Hypothetical protein FKW44_004910 [Caligus rogercresseyi]|uniref:Uncharacterized protein n=1 Tax=Caligus rogercresseyi TaxID=217165 RepID=A0A7T8HMG2_CALRO|nr:Hypothetical protein FKW44_004910 [Caligus rogercresseyi]
MDRANEEELTEIFGQHEEGDHRMENKKRNGLWKNKTNQLLTVTNLRLMHVI